MHVPSTLFVLSRKLSSILMHSQDLTFSHELSSESISLHLLIRADYFFFLSAEHCSRQVNNMIFVDAQVSMTDWSVLIDTGEWFQATLTNYHLLARRSVPDLIIKCIRAFDLYTHSSIWDLAIMERARFCQ